jgi:hypothetical protein
MKNNHLFKNKLIYKLLNILRKNNFLNLKITKSKIKILYNNKMKSLVKIKILIKKYNIKIKIKT